MEPLPEKRVGFADFDHKLIYDDSCSRAHHPSTCNFAVEFGKAEAQIAFDLSANEAKSFLARPVAVERPVRWINIWGPHRQKPVIDFIGEHYGLSQRLRAIVRTAPPEPPEFHLKEETHARPSSNRSKDDIEIAAVVDEKDRRDQLPTRRTVRDISHYRLAEQMINYQSIDFGARFLCIGANWMHEMPKADGEDTNEPDIVEEGKQKRLWCWLILCDDHTVISLHEYSGFGSTEELKATRSNTVSVLTQLSHFGRNNTDPMSMQTVRQALPLDTAQEGLELASLLFYYLFDDWKAVYTTVDAYHRRLEELQLEILGDMTRKSSQAPNIKIIPRLHILGTQIRQNQHLYSGYKNLIYRILESQATPKTSGSTSSLANLSSSHNGVQIAQSARQRFERLGDRIQLLILSETQEFLAEKDALINTYFNINAQKDSESSARLTRSATLLAKLSVLFLPVSLMTSYFSIQIADLQGVYTSRDYWYSFAGIMSISFLALFFFSKLLMAVTETLDSWMKVVSNFCTRKILRWRTRDEDGG